eukprot:sb/3468320/
MAPLSRPPKTPPYQPHSTPWYNNYWNTDKNYWNTDKFNAWYTDNNPWNTDNNPWNTDKNYWKTDSNAWKTDAWKTDSNAWKTDSNAWNTENDSPWNSSIADPYGSGTGRGFATGNYTPDGIHNAFSELLARHPTELLRQWSPGTIFPSPDPSGFNPNDTGILWAPVGNSSDPPGVQWVTIASSGPAILICLLTSIILGVIILRQGMDAIKVLYSVLCYVFSMVFLIPNSNPHLSPPGVSNADHRGVLVPGAQPDQAEIRDELQA